MDTNTKKVIIIMDIGINHSGNIQIAKDLMKIAKESGCDLVKFQKRDINSTYSQEELNKYRETPFGTTNKELKEHLEFGKIEYDIIAAYSKYIDIPFFVSCWDLPSVKFMEQYNCPYNKIASPMLTHKELLKNIAEQKKHTFISTGLSTMDEIEAAVEIFKSASCSFELMACNSTYPCPDEELNINNIITLRNKFKCNVGYSCHSPSIIFASVAVALGATSIEKHGTLSRSSFGSDQASSVEPHGIKQMVNYIRSTEKALGNGIKIVTEAEEKIKTKLRRTKDYQ